MVGEPVVESFKSQDEPFSQGIQRFGFHFIKGEPVDFRHDFLPEQATQQHGKNRQIRLAPVDDIRPPEKQICNDDLSDADALITRSVTKCDTALLDGTPVKLIATATIGDDHIDKIFCKKNGITVVAAVGCNASAVEQYVISALLTLVERMQFSIKGLKLGVVGVGNVGSRVKYVAELLGMKTFTELSRNF